MRVATVCVVLIIHVVFFILFAALRSPLPRASQEEEPSMAFFLPPDEVDTAAEVAPQSPTTPQAARRPIPKRAAAATARSPDAIARPEPQSPPNAITMPAAPDWRHEMQIAANNAIEAEERKRHQPSPLAPHDFSGVKPGSTDDTKPRFGWNHAATHRVEELPNGGVLININDRCVIAWVIFPFPLCKVGKMPSRGDLFKHMKDPPALVEPEVP
jgi:hypothetical protein